jgi:hypothetical protein
MNRVVLIAVFAVAVAAGCKKKPKDTSGDTPPPPAPPTPYVSSGGSPVAPNQQGNLTGGQGAIQGPRTAAAREANHAQVRDLHLSMLQSFLLDNRLPSINEIMQEAQRNSQLLPLLKGEVIILTGATGGGDQVWAYTQYPQKAGEHYVITQAGVDQMSPEVLRKRLEAQSAPVKLSK